VLFQRLCHLQNRYSEVFLANLLNEYGVLSEHTQAGSKAFEVIADPRAFDQRFFDFKVFNSNC
jgi:hypothetical protein